MTRPAPFGRTVTAMVTPFRPGGAVDLDGAKTLARHLVANGSDGLVVTGSTGEISTLTDDEQVDLWTVVREAVEVPLVAGATSNDTAHSIELTRRATEIGVDGILAVTPYYNRPSQAGIAAHFRAIADATDLPVILYDIPSRSVRRISADVIVELVETCENVVGLKDAAGDPGGTARLLSQLPESFACYSGDDGLLLPLLAVGAGGIISVAAHWCGLEISEVIGSYLAGDVEHALEVFRAVLPSFAFESSDAAPNPIPTKAVLRCLGLPGGDCRLPLGPAPAGLEDEAKHLISDLDAWRLARGPLG